MKKLGNMKVERLGNIAEIIAGQSPPSDTYNQNNEGLPFFQGTADFGEMYPKARYWCKEPKKIALANDILMAVRAPVGPVNICNVRSCIGRGLSAIRVKSNYNYRYIYYFLKTGEKQIAKLGVGSTFKSITQKEIARILVSIPERLDDQIRIATLLNKAESLIQKRKESIALLDEFLKSTFLELFGDPVRNEKGWGKIKLGVLGNWKSGGTPSRNKREYFSGNIPWITSRELNDLYINDSGEKITEEAILNSNAKFIEEQSLLLGMYDTAALKSSINTVHISCNQAIAYAKLNNELCNTLFVYFNIQIGKDYFRKQQRGVRQQNMNLSMIKELKILNPPLHLQNHFGQIVEKTNYLKTQYQQSQQELENLYFSLSQRAFKGEFDLDKLEISYKEEYSNQGNDQTEPIALKPDVETDKKKAKEPAEKQGDPESSWRFAKTLGNAEGIKFNHVEGNAVLADIFSKKRAGFSFQQFDQFLKKERFKYSYKDLQEFIFQQLEEKKLTQYYASEEWMKSDLKKADQEKDDFAGEGSIWLMVNNSK